MLSRHRGRETPAAFVFGRPPTSGVHRDQLGDKLTACASPKEKEVVAVLEGCLICEKCPCQDLGRWGWRGVLLFSCPVLPFVGTTFKPALRSQHKLMNLMLVPALNSCQDNQNHGQTFQSALSIFQNKLSASEITEFI